MSDKLFDEKCLELARHFSKGAPIALKTKEKQEDLAHAIQLAVEDWFAEQRQPRRRQKS